MLPPTSTPAVAPADRVLHVLSVLAQSPRALNAQELMQACRLPRSTLYRVLARLKNFGLLQEQAGNYTPGPLCMQLAVGFERDSALVQIARPVLAQLSLSTQESAGLIVASNDHALCLAMAESAQSLRCSFAPGRSVPLQHGASALCLLAHLPTPQRETVLTRHYGTDSPARQQAQQRLQHIRNDGFAITCGEVDPGVWGCSVPLFGPARRAVGAFTLMAPEQRASAQQAAWLQQTLAAAARISQMLKDSPPPQAV